MHRVYARIALREFAYHGQALVDLLLAELTNVEMYNIAVWRLDGAALLLLMPERLAEAVARAQLHGFLARPWIGRTEIVVLQVTIAVLVDQDAALSTRSLGNQNA